MRENGFRAIGGLAQKLTSGIARDGAKGGRGAALVRLKADWPAVVGPELARTTRPDALLVVSVCMQLEELIQDGLNRGPLA